MNIMAVSNPTDKSVNERIGNAYLVTSSGLTPPSVFVSCRVSGVLMAPAEGATAKVATISKST